MPFDKFNQAVKKNDFWKKPVSLVNHLIERKTSDDKLPLTGVSLVIGCPFPDEILTAIEIFKKILDKEINNAGLKVNWRNKPEALHLTLSGLILPRNFRESNWPLVPGKIEEIKLQAEKIKGVKLSMGAAGILGMGAVAIGVADDFDIEMSNSQRLTKKIVLGRLEPKITETNRKSLKETLEKYGNHEIGSFIITNLKIVKYLDTFLENIADSVLIIIG